MHYGLPIDYHQQRSRSISYTSSYSANSSSSVEIKNVVDWKFLLCSKSMGQNSIVFNSLDAVDKYMLYKKAQGVSNFNTAKELQTEGFALPLLETEVANVNSVSPDYMSIYKYSPPPPDEPRLFSKDTDKHVYCKVKRFWFSNYYKYNITFTPNPSNLSKTVNCTLVVHHKLSVADMTLHNSKRYRWVHTTLDNSNDSWSYGLYALNTADNSYSDDEMELDGNRTSSSNISRIGEFKYYKTYFRQYSGDSARFEFQQSVTSTEGNDQDMDEINCESILSATEEALMFLCTCLILRANCHDTSFNKAKVKALQKRNEISMRRVE